MRIYRGPHGNIRNMLTSTLTFGEWERIIVIMEYVLGNDSFKRRFDGETLTLREEVAFRRALLDMFGNSVPLQEAWLTDSITGATQSIADTNARDFKARHSNLQPRDQVIPWMPFTTVNHQEIALIEKILTFLVGDLWVRQFDNNEDITTNLHVSDKDHSDEDFTKLTQTGKELLGDTAWVVYSSRERDLTQEEQTEADAKMAIFMDKYRDRVEVATIPQMPFTTLTAYEYSQIQTILTSKLGSDVLWTRYISGDLSFSIADRNNISQVGSEWMGSLKWLTFSSGQNFSQADQPEVDANSRAFIQANSGLLTDFRRERRVLNHKSRHFIRKKQPERHRQLSDTTDDVTCASAQEIREYLKDKTIVVYTTQSYVKDAGEDGIEEAELVQFLEPLAEKRLDFKYHKSMEAVFQKQNIEIQDSYYQIFMPDSQLLSYPETRVQHEDVVTREYWDGDAQEYINTQESMLAIKLWLENTTNEQKRIAYDSMTFLGDIGGLFEIIIYTVTPLVSLFVGDRLTYYLLGKLFMANTSNRHGNNDFNSDDDDNSNNSTDPEAKKREWKNWLLQTRPYKTNCRTQLTYNRFLSCLFCRRLRIYREKTPADLMLEEGARRVKRDLDIRNLIKSQDMLKTILKMKVDKKEKRKLMRLQRRNIVLEPVSDRSDDSEEDFKDYIGAYKHFKDDFDDLVDSEGHDPSDVQHMKLFRGVLEKDAFEPQKQKQLKKQKSIQSQKSLSSSQKSSSQPQKQNSLKRLQSPAAITPAPPSPKFKTVTSSNANDRSKVARLMVRKQTKVVDFESDNESQDSNYTPNTQRPITDKSIASDRTTGKQDSSTINLLPSIARTLTKEAADLLTMDPGSKSTNLNVGSASNMSERTTAMEQTSKTINVQNQASIPEDDSQSEWTTTLKDSSTMKQLRKFDLSSTLGVNSNNSKQGSFTMHSNGSTKNVTVKRKFIKQTQVIPPGQSILEDLKELEELTEGAEDEGGDDVIGSTNVNDGAKSGSAYSSRGTRKWQP